MFDEKKIVNITNLFIKFKSFYHTIFPKSRILNLILFYSRIKNIVKTNSLKNFNTVLQLKSTKKQLISTIFKNKKVIYYISNGFFIKKLALKKSQKKDHKVSILNLKNIIEFFKKTHTQALVVNIFNAKSFSVKYLHFLKNNLKSMNTLYFYSPNISFSKKKFKKVKSIKRKLKKKYVFSV